MQVTIKRLEELIQQSKEQNKVQENIMLHKESELIQFRQDKIHYEQKLK